MQASVTDNCNMCIMLQGVLSCFAGRLLLDTYVQSRDLLKEVEYSLATLSGKLLGQQRMELNPHQVRSPCCPHV